MDIAERSVVLFHVLFVIAYLSRRGRLDDMHCPTPVLRLFLSAPSYHASHSTGSSGSSSSSLPVSPRQRPRRLPDINKPANITPPHHQNRQRITNIRKTSEKPRHKLRIPGPGPRR